MDKPTVYIESSIIGVLTSLPSSNIVKLAMQTATRDWWIRERSKFTLYLSELVLSEIRRGDISASQRRLHTVRGLPILELNDPIRQIADSLIASKLLPVKAFDDAVHIATAAYYRIDYLLTWNCKHIANMTTFRQVSDRIEKSGFHCPVMVTPLSLYLERREIQ